MIMKGQKINDRYEIIKTIGEGGMANVYLAHDVILDRPVAVKILRGDLANDEKFVRRFQREAISASSLSHPNIVEMYDVGEDNSKYFIVMEYVNGKTLKNLIKKRGSLTIPEVMDIMLQLTSGIAHAHDSYIIHRDLKPQNVMILDDGLVKITDFGIAMALNSNELTQTNSVMGSVHYLPPEQANGSGSTIKSDIYSLGIMMFELLTGKIPFKGENAVEIAIKQMKEQIPSIVKMNPEIPQSVENIILKACAKNPQNRYETAGDMHEDIKNCMNQEKINDKRLVYKFPEHELEKTTKMPNLKDFMPKRKEKTVVQKNSDDHHEDSSFINKSLLFGTLLFLFLSIVIAFIVLIYPVITKVPEVVVPDVSNLSAVKAEEKLEKLGFKVSSQDEKQSHSSIEEGYVIKTEPGANRSVKKGIEIKLIVSSGVETIVLEDFKGKNFYEVKAFLEANDIHVLEEKKEVEDIDNLKEYTILDQIPIAGEKVSAGDTVTLILPEIITEYPDFVGEGWTLTQVREFADKYKIYLEVVYEESTEFEVDKIIYQSRAKESRVEANAYLKVKVAKAPGTDLEPGEMITE